MTDQSPLDFEPFLATSGGQAAAQSSMQWLMPFMVVIEFFSMFIKVFALALRLFAIMLGGHVVIGILVGLILVFPGWGFLALPLALFIYALEILIAFLQAYVFCLLSAIFIANMLHPEH